MKVCIGYPRGRVETDPRSAGLTTWSDRSPMTSGFKARCPAFGPRGVTIDVDTRRAGSREIKYRNEAGVAP